MQVHGLSRDIFVIKFIVCTWITRRTDRRICRSIQRAFCTSWRSL